MVVVAIIGILAAVAVPQFTRFQAKARQSEGKGMLTALYTAEKGFQAEYAGFATSFQAIGFSPVGDALYDVGFVTLCANWGACAPMYEPNGAGTAPVAANGPGSAFTFCVAYGAVITVNNGCRMKQTGNLAAGIVGPIAIAGAANTANQTSFQATSSAVVYTGYTAAPDIWTINQNKVLFQVSAGVP